MLVAFFRLRVFGVIYASLLSAVVVTTVMAVQCYRRIAPAFDLRTFVAMVKYAWPLGMGGIAMLFIHVGDRFILPHYRPLADLGLYVLAYKIGMMMSFIYGAFDIHWSAQVFKIMRRGDADTVFGRTLTYVILGTSVSGLALVVFARPVTPGYGRSRHFRVLRRWFLSLSSRITFGSIGDFLRYLFLVEDRSAL